MKLCDAVEKHELRILPLDSRHAFRSFDCQDWYTTKGGKAWMNCCEEMYAILNAAWANGQLWPTCKGDRKSMRLGWVSLMLSDGGGEVKPGVDKYHCDQKKTCDAGLGIICLDVYDTRKEKARKKDHYTVAFRSSERPSEVSEIRVRSGFAYFLSADSPALLLSPHRQLEGCYRLAVREPLN